MVDVLLVLLVFFISITSTEVLRRSRDLDLPESAQASLLDRAFTKQVIINLKWLAPVRQTLMTMDGRSYVSVSELATRLRERAITDPGVRVLIRADREVEYRHVAQLISACSSANIDQIHFATLSDHISPEK